MSIEKPPAGTRGGRGPAAPVVRLVKPVLLWVHRRSHDRMGDMDLLYLTTTGAKTGRSRTSPVARFDDGRGGWLVVASAGGAAGHPAWYHNLAAHPDQVWAEVSGARHHVAVEQLGGADREAAWATVVARSPRFDSYGTKTDRQLPVLRLTPQP